jgi:hypothetical protein
MRKDLLLVYQTDLTSRACLCHDEITRSVLVWLGIADRQTLPGVCEPGPGRRDASTYTEQSVAALVKSARSNLLCSAGVNAWA